MSLVTKLVSHVMEPLYRERMRSLERQNEYLEESLDTLRLEMENEGWMRLTASIDYHMTRERLAEVIKLATNMAIKNPITNRTINVQADYVFGQGVRFVAKHPDIQKVVDEFVSYCENKKVITSHTAMLQAERSLQVWGNLFFPLFVNPQTGRVIVRMFDIEDVVDVIRDPNDYQKELFIKRQIEGDNGSTQHIYYPAYGVTKEAYPRDPWNYAPSERHEPGSVEWEVQVIHLCFNRFGKSKFAIPEVFAQLDWANAYKRFLENWASIMQSFSRMALKIVGLGGKKQAAAAKSMLSTTITSSNVSESNPPHGPAATGLFGKGVDVEPVKTAGATTDAAKGAPILNMAAAGAGVPNTFVDASSGNYATAQTLDRPTELKMTSRQKLWVEFYDLLFAYVILQSAKAPDGLLQKAGFTVDESLDVFTGLPSYSTVAPDAETDITVKAIFPSILERNVTDRVRALVNAVTLFGKPLTDIIPDKKLVATLLMEALNVPDIEKWIPIFMQMWEKNMQIGDDGKPVAADIIPPPPPDKSAGGAEDPSQGGDVGANG